MDSREIHEASRKRAIHAYRNDVRFRAMAMSVVAEALHNHGPVDPEYADRDVSRIATDVAAIVLQRIYEEDAELGRLKAERDQYRSLLVGSIGLVNQPLSIFPGANAGMLSLAK